MELVLASFNKNLIFKIKSGDKTHTYY